LAPWLDLKWMAQAADEPVRETTMIFAPGASKELAQESTLHP
jgi:hypothetical protein